MALDGIAVSGSTLLPLFQYHDDGLTNQPQSKFHVTPEVKPPTRATTNTSFPKNLSRISHPSKISLSPPQILPTPKRSILRDLYNIQRSRLQQGITGLGCVLLSRVRVYTYAPHTCLHVAIVCMFWEPNRRRDMASLPKVVQ